MPRPVLLLCTLASVLLMPATTLLAQEQARTTSVARMFLFTDDPLGLLIIWFLVMLSAVSIGYALSLMMRYRRKTLLPYDTHRKLIQLLDAKQFRDAIDYARRDVSYLGRIVHAGLSEAVHGYGAMERAIEEAGDNQTTKALRPIEYLNVVGNIAPMIGLFGTVYGMIRAFDQLQASGGKPDPAQLAGGISTAMITTFWGLIVAIPALASYALIRNKVDALTSEGMVIAEEIIAPFKPTNAPNQMQTGSEQPRPSAPQRPSSNP